MLEFDTRYDSRVCVGEVSCGEAVSARENSTLAYGVNKMIICQKYVREYLEVRNVFQKSRKLRSRKFGYKLQVLIALSANYC